MDLDDTRLPVLGCIADDYTGAGDVASALRRVGLRVALLFGEPGGELEIPVCDALVVALKTRTAPVPVALASSGRVAAWMSERGVQTVYFKYCSTFDSTDAGNIGPVAEALAEKARHVTVVCPATPEHGRTVYAGHLFVGERLLAETSMRDHPLTPMTDSDLVRVLGRQVRVPPALIGLDVVRRGPDAVSRELAALTGRGVRLVVVDATAEQDLRTVAEATRGHAVLTGAAGLARQAGSVRAEQLGFGDGVPVRPLPGGPSVIVAGSCSAATLEQIALAREHIPAFRVDPCRGVDVGGLTGEAVAWLDRNLTDSQDALIYSSVPPEQRRDGSADAAVVERVLANVAVHAVEQGARRLVLAGGETSGAVIEALGVRAVEVVEEADVGVPWTRTTTDPELALLLKSGNFGGPDLFLRAVGR
jgi:uncharacterized protein YgbK (DUF1537 family)